MFEYGKIMQAARWNRNDTGLVLAVLMLGFLLGTAALFMQDGAEAVVTIKGRETARYSLTDDGEYLLRGDGGSNTLQIREGSVRVLEADCPDRLCVHQGWISRAGQSLICLPHKLAVTIQGREAQKAETDAMAQ